MSKDIFSPSFDWDVVEHGIEKLRKPDFYTFTHHVDWENFKTNYSFPPIERGLERHLIIPETHLSDKNRANRVNYVHEMKCIFNTVIEAVKEYTPDEALFMGEIFDRGFSSVPELLYWFDTLFNLRKYTKISTVKGNHEDSFYKNNPYWYLIGMGLIATPPNRISHNVALNYYHFNEPCTPLYGSKTIGFSHADIMTATIRKALNVNNNYLKDSNETSTQLFPRHDVVFNGHLHQMCDMININRSPNPLTLIYTSTLGRTSLPEIKASGEQCIVYLYLLDIFYDDVKITPIPIELPDYDSVVDQKAKDISTQKYSHQKDKKSISPIITDVNGNSKEDAVYKILETNYDLRVFYNTIQKTSPHKILSELEYILSERS